MVIKNNNSMSLIVYECQRAGHGHEIRQFGVPPNLYMIILTGEMKQLYLSVM